MNMSDRLGAIGGTVEWRSAPGEGAEISGTDPADVTDDEPQPDDDRAGSAAGPVVAIARSEVRTRWLGLVLIGLLAGVVGAGRHQRRRPGPPHDHRLRPPGRGHQGRRRAGLRAALPRARRRAHRPARRHRQLGRWHRHRQGRRRQHLPRHHGRTPSALTDLRSDRARGPPPPSLAGPRRHRDRAARRLPARGRRPARDAGSPSSS